ncbi:MAG: hypothetical protein ATN36_01525 [Epulopiscium sp. Nele67-Bin005]|nr:MAG: hypothetical protein ATN36_01525 [Epulopiscium sp. Nele67-Bin005]
MKKVLVCITIQQNSKRLMDKGKEVATEFGAELHVLHIRMGATIFDTPTSHQLFEELFAYGSEIGGEVHFLCSSNVTKTISDFIKENKISHLVVGSTSQNASTVLEELQRKIKSLDEIIVVERAKV